MLSIYQDHITLQTFADSKQVIIYPAIKEGTLQDLSAWAKTENQKGACISASVNEMRGGRDIEHCTKVRAYYCDIDGLHSEAHKAQTMYTLLTSKLPPSAIVKSGNGVHAYWYAKEGEPIDKDYFTKIEMGIIQAFNGCPRAKDLARALRVPGFYHMKNPHAPYLIDIAFEDPSVTYSGEDLARAYPYKEPVKPRQHRSTQSFMATADGAEAWHVVLQALREWYPIEGEKHRVLMQTLGVAVKFKRSENETFNDLLPIVESWPTRTDAYSTLKSNCRWAFSKGGECTVSGLRSLGVEVPSLGKYMQAAS